MKLSLSLGQFTLRKIEAVRWRSWLSHLSNTQKVPGSNPGRTILVALGFYFYKETPVVSRQQRC
jgi:hypothetical protein